MAILYYIHDPMCSWCWGFVPTLEDLLSQLPDEVEVKRLLGGLAPDTDEAMPDEMRGHIQGSWRRIQEHLPGTVFNFDFWTKCQPRRSTYPACRAVIAARRQGAEFDVLMTRAIQRAYYTQARNPSDEDTLIALAEELGLDTDLFTHTLRDNAIQLELEQEIDTARAMGVDSFPSLMLEVEGAVWPIPVDYRDSSPMLELINSFLTS